MPIVVTQPTTGAPIGEGLSINWQYTTVGPVFQPFWRIYLQDTDGVTTLVLQDFAVTGDVHDAQNHFLEEGSYEIAGSGHGIQFGQNARIRIELRSGQMGFGSPSSLVDHVEVTGVLSDAGHVFLLQNWLALHQLSSSSLTPLQDQVTALSTQVTTVVSAVERTFASGIVGKIADTILSPSPPFMVRELIGDFSGHQSFQRTAPGIGVNAFGLTWQVLTYGGGIGLDDTTPVEFEVELLGIEQRHTLADGFELTTTAGRFRWSGGVFLFSPSFPTRINVTVAPSVTMRFWWLLAGLG